MLLIHDEQTQTPLKTATLPGFEHYIFLANGDVWSKQKNRLLKQKKGTSYCVVNLTTEANGGENKTYLSHLLIARAFLGECPQGMEVDHIDRDKTNNQVENLRYVTRSQNARNTARIEASSSQYCGVAWVKELHCWRAQISRGGRTSSLGLHVSEEDAARAYDEAAAPLGRELNFPLK